MAPALRLASQRVVCNNRHASLFVPLRASPTLANGRPLIVSCAEQMGMAHRIRIDRLLVERGLFESRTQAQSAIAAGRVRVNEVVVARPSEEIPADAVLRAEPAHPYVHAAA